jgi:hypothetical protein
MSETTIHTYTTSDGWKLCNVCGKPEKDELHGYQKPGPEKLANGNFVCPSCDGRKETFVMACGPKGGWQGYRPCDRCKGTGEITKEHVERIRLGKIMREDRVNARRVTQREEAARLGCGIGEWSQIEYGKEPETEEGRKALETRLNELGLSASSTTFGRLAPVCFNKGVRQ